MLIRKRVEECDVTGSDCYFSEVLSQVYTSHPLELHT